MSLPKLVSMVMRWILSFASGMGLYDTSISLLSSPTRSP
jgi:hypothetical protein